MVKLVLIISAIIMTATAFTTSTSRMMSRQPSHVLFLTQRRGSNSDPVALETCSLATLPVFPLRKSIRLPTESLTLNLYEDRYIALSEFILEQKQPIFGALYSSDKPQIVKAGLGPIVPMLEPGNVGVLCFVKEWEDDMVPTRDSSFERRRIRLNALAVSRFQITEIIRDGTMASGSTNPEFILVKASLITDKIIDVDERKEITRLENILSRRIQEQSKTVAQKIGDEMNQINDQGGNTGSSAVEVLSLASYKDKENQEAEVFSFSATSLLCPTWASSEIRGEMLQMTSTKQRLEQITKWGQD